LLRGNFYRFSFDFKTFFPLKLSHSVCNLRSMLACMHACWRVLNRENIVHLWSMPVNAYLVVVCVVFGVRNCLDGMCGLFMSCLRRIFKGVHCICKIWKGASLSSTPTLKSVHSKGNQLSVPKSKLRMNHPNLLFNSHKPCDATLWSLNESPCWFLNHLPCPDFLSAEYKEARH